jgi:hypothetical protein
MREGLHLEPICLFLLSAQLVGDREKRCHTSMPLVQNSMLRNTGTVTRSSSFMSLDQTSGNGKTRFAAFRAPIAASHITLADILQDLTGAIIGYWPVEAARHPLIAYQAAFGTNSSFNSQRGFGSYGPAFARQLAGTCRRTRHCRRHLATTIHLLGAVTCGE